MPVRKLKEFLNKNNVRYVSISHSIAYTAQEVAASSHVAGREMAKTVMIKIGGEMAMAVLPSTFQIDFHLLKKGLNASSVILAGEGEFKGMFGDCELGAMPPFGPLYGIKVFVDETLKEDEEIAFNAGSHTEIIKLAYNDFERLAEPKLLKFSYK